MKVPWWAIPAVAAIVLTVGSVAAAEGSLGSSRVAVPGDVQLANHPVGAPDTTTVTTVPLSGSAQPATVVAPSRPVVTQTAPLHATATVGVGVTSAVPSPPATDAPSTSGGDNAPVPLPDPSTPPSTLAASVPPTTSTMPPTTSTTSTTRPWRGDE